MPRLEINYGSIPLFDGGLDALVGLISARSDPRCVHRRGTDRQVTPRRDLIRPSVSGPGKQVQIQRRGGGIQTYGRAAGPPGRVVPLAPGERLLGVRIWQPPAGPLAALQLVTSRGLSRRCGGRAGPGQGAWTLAGSAEDPIVGLRAAGGSGAEGAAGLRVEGVVRSSEERRGLGEERRAYGPGGGDAGRANGTA